jgi:hypothetical protein
MQDLPTLSILIAATSVVAGVILSTRSLRNIKINRQASLFMQIFNRFYTEDFLLKRTQIQLWTWDSYQDFHNKYGWKTNPEAFTKFMSIGAFIGGIGVLVSQGLINLRLVDELLGAMILETVEKYAPILKELEKDLDRPFISHWVLYLTDLLKKQSPR